MRILPILFGMSILMPVATMSSEEDAHETVRLTEIAAKICASEWDAVQVADPDAWSTLEPIEIDPEIDPAILDAFNKFSAAAVSVAEYVGVFLGFADAKNHTQHYQTMAQAKFDLLQCLTPTPVERDLLVELGQQSTDAQPDVLRASLFGGFDHFDCMNIAGASDAIFAQDMTDLTDGFDFDAITSEHLRVCQ